MASTAVLFWSCRWDWCRASFSSRDALVEHIVHHTTTAPPLTQTALKQLERLESDHPFSLSEESWLASTPRPSQRPAATSIASSSQLDVPRTPQPPPISPKREPESPAPHSWANAHVSLLSPTLPPPPPAHTSSVSFANLASGVEMTPPLPRLPRSPTSEEQIYRYLRTDRGGGESDVSVDSLARRKTPAARARKSVSHRARSAEGEHSALPYPSFSDDELDASDAESDRNTVAVASQSLEAQPLAPLVLETQMPLTQSSQEWDASSMPIT